MQNFENLDFFNFNSEKASFIDSLRAFTNCLNGHNVPRKDMALISEFINEQISEQTDTVRCSWTIFEEIYKQHPGYFSRSFYVSLILFTETKKYAGPA